jgi:hypothetical protein
LQAQLPYVDQSETVKLLRVLDDLEAATPDADDGSLLLNVDRTRVRVTRYDAPPANAVILTVPESVDFGFSSPFRG